MLRKSILGILVVFSLLTVALFSQTEDVLSLQDAITLYEDDETVTYLGHRPIEKIKELLSEDINTSDYYDPDYYRDYDCGDFIPIMYASRYEYTEIENLLKAAGARE